MNDACTSGEFRIAIVGMGATGVAAFVHLARALGRRGIGRRVTVHCFETSAHLGRGLAYSTQEDCHRLNMRAATMSLFSEQPEDFIDWLARNREGSSPQRGNATRQHYVPRRQFGEYLSVRFAESVELARRHGVHVVHHHAQVLAMDKRAGAYGITTPEARIECDAALLCLGYLPRRATEAFEQNPHFLANPFDAARLDQIPRDARVGVLGSSLTAIDAVLALERRGFKGELTCFARRRGLPKVQPAPQAPANVGSHPVTLRACTSNGITRAMLRAGGRLSLRQAFQLLRDELHDVPGAHDLTHEAQRWDGYHALSTLRRDVAQARAGHVPWYPVLDATGAVAPQLWRALADASKREFLRDYESLWAMVRHCMPLPTAERLLALVEARALDVRVGLRSVKLTTVNDGAADPFELECRTSQGASLHHVDYLIDARGAEFDLSRLESPLLDSLRQAGFLRACPHGGVDVDFDTCGLIDAHGQRASSLFFVGPLTKGVHFYTNSFKTQRDNVQRAIAAILASQEQPRVRAAHAPRADMQLASGGAT